MDALPFDAIGSLFIFLIGVPALVVQSIPPEVRHVVARRWQRLLLETGLPVVVAAAAVGLGLLRHALWPADAVAIGGGGLFGRVPLPPAGPWTWVIVIAVMFATATYTAMRIPHRYGRRSMIIRSLEKESFKHSKLIEHSLDDLIVLGRQSESGQDKELVLQALYRLATKMYDLRDYRGDRLEALIMGLVDMLVPASQPGNAQNFSTAAQILQHITKSAKPRSPDVLSAIQALGSLGQAALIHAGPLNIRPTVMKYVQALGLTVNRHPAHTTDVSQALFEVGVVAVQKRQILIAMAALAELLNLVQANKPARAELVTDLLGLIAHFWTAGETACEYVRGKLAEIVDSFALPLDEALEQARRHCAQTTQFQVADNLGQLSRDLQQTPLVPTPAPAPASLPVGIAASNT
jgi:hypothetical protein